MIYITFLFGYLIIMTILIYVMVQLYIEGVVSTNGYLVIMCIVITITFIILLIKWRSGIRMSIAFLNIAVFIMKKYPSSVIFSYLNIIGESLINVVYVACFAVININMKNYDFEEHGNEAFKNAFFDFSHMNSLSKFLSIFLGISYLFNKTVIENVIYSTISGVYASYLFNTVDEKKVRKKLLVSSFKRAISKSLGSICFGSLTYSILEFINSILEYIHFFVYYFMGFFIIDHIIYRRLSDEVQNLINWTLLLPWTIVEILLKYFNEYAFALIAIKDISYRKAVIESLEIIKQKEEEIEIRELIMGRILDIYKIIIYIFGVGISVLLSIVLNQSKEEVTFYFFLSYASASSIYSSISSVINSSVITTFLCYCGIEDCLDKINSSLLLDIIGSDDDEEEEEEDDDDDDNNNNNNNNNNNDN